MNAPPAAADPPYAKAPTWRRQPYRLFFALGLLHAWAGVSPWFTLAMGWSSVDRRVYHSIAQIQGFMLCFAVGFLFTMIPRRTRTEAPGPWQMVIGLVCPVGATVCGAMAWFSVSQAFWFLLAATLVTFVISRVRRGTATGSLPGLVWVPLAIGLGVLGSLYFAAFGILGRAELHQLGKLFLLQGMFLGLVLGVGGLVFPLFTRGETAPPARPGDGWRRAVHVLAAAVLIASFYVEVYVGPRPGYAMRAALTLSVLLWAARIHRLPRLPGINRLLVWGTAWMLPVGYGLAAWFAPAYASAGLHVVFIAGFASMAFAVGMHVCLAHGGRKDLAGSWPWQIVAYAVLFLVAVVARTLMVFDPARYFLWMGAAAGAFLLGTLFWAVLAAPYLLPRSASTEVT